MLYNDISIQMRATLQLNNTPHTHTSTRQSRWQWKNNEERCCFSFKPFKSKLQYFLLYSDSLMNCQYHEAASAMSLSLEMRCCFIGLDHSAFSMQMIFSQRPNYADILAVNTMRDIWKSPLYCTMMGINPSAILLLLQSRPCLHMLQAFSAIWWNWWKLQSKL